MKEIKKSLKFTVILLMIGCIIETIHYQETFPDKYHSLSEAWGYTVLSAKHAATFFLVFFIPTFAINYLVNKL